MSRIDLSAVEQLTALVYGDTFALYDEQAFDEFLAPLKTRLAVNGIDTSVFAGARCLDAGCGGGRGSILMAQAGAREVVAVDLSPTNIESTRRRATQKGVRAIEVRQHSLMELPFGDDEFDVVWCNGVLHHTADPDRGLKEITRVLKPQGRLWLYLYGSGGIYWRVVDWIRDTLSDVDVSECIHQLQLMEVPVRRIAEWIDDWFVPYLRRYRTEDVAARLRELGYADVERLHKGVGYDTSQRRLGATSDEIELMGEGDVRFFCRKVSSGRTDQERLPDPPGGKGSDYHDRPAVAQFEKPLAELKVAVGLLESRRSQHIGCYKILVCAALHSKVRGLLENRAAFDAAALHEHIARYVELVTTFPAAAPRR